MGSGLGYLGGKEERGGPGAVRRWGPLPPSSRGTPRAHTAARGGEGGEREGGPAALCLGLRGDPDSSQSSAHKWLDIITMTTAVYKHTNNRDEIDKRLACQEKYNKFLI